ncbi:MAG: ribosome maturation factor RimP [Candidatus Krumholzibacteria bacterium]|nr:ribosome maturation factor RimP [Candidatus Krumholzibacteria bacterium]
MDLEKELKEIVERELDTLGYELVKTESFQQGRRRTIRLFIDRPDGTVSIDDCVRATKALGLVLDGVETLPGPYNLEISSPGFARPLTKTAHFARFRGKRARVEYVETGGGKTTAIGTISEATAEAVILSVDGAERRIAFEKILKANLHPADQGTPEPERRPRERRGRR